MEAPDASGFVNITWPSKNVPHGGIFHTRIANSSTEQQQFLKVLVEESRLDIKLRHESGYGLRRAERSPPPPPAQAQTTTVRPRTSRRRSLSAIRLSTLLDADSYCPIKKGEDREKLKDKLVKAMAYGECPEQAIPAPMAGRPIKDTAQKKLPTEKQKWNELVGQIRERAEWLAEMEYLGEGDAHRETINQQIAERMRALDCLGIDSQCSSARSDISGFSTTRSREKIYNVAPVEKLASERSNASSKRSMKREGNIPLSGQSLGKQSSGTKPRFTGRGPVVESVAAYNQLSPLGYSPRRRV